MTHIRGDINQVAEILKIAYTGKETAFQDAWIYHVSYTTAPGTSGVVFDTIPTNTTQLLKQIQISCNNLAFFMNIEIDRASDGAVLFSSIFFQNQQFDLNDIIIPSGDYIDLRWTNNSGGNVDFTITMLSVDAVGVLT